jgi:16S rRNA (guanine527-N7)-methyltransferase
MDAMFGDAAARYGVHLSEAQLARFAAYQSLLAEWNQRINLVGDASPATVRERHFLESIALGAALREREALRPDSRVLDVGAGAGFPGVVLKIAWPQIRLTLIEATSKKAAFLEALTTALGFDDRVAVVADRAETLAHDPDLRAQFDLVVARAVAPLPTLLELTLPFARVGGRVATPKGERAEAEIAKASHALVELGGKLVSMRLDVPGPTQTLVVAIKQRPTPAMYPRRPGIPAKSPL